VSGKVLGWEYWKWNTGRTYVGHAEHHNAVDGPKDSCRQRN
jgi:hypothetical protein